MKGKFRFKFVSLLLAMLSFLSLSAHDFEVDGIFYNIIDENAKTAEVTFKGDAVSTFDNEYDGEVIIPATVIYNNEIYSVVEIDSYTFFDCFGITKVVMPETLKKIGDSAFKCCYELKTAVIPNGVTTIGAEAFRLCENLETISIPETVNSIGWYAFDETIWFDAQSNGLLYLDNCCLGYKGEALSGNVVISNNTRLISSFAFKSCSGIKSIILPSSVAQLGDYLFDGNNQGLSMIYSYCTFPPASDENTFYEVDTTNCVVYVPIGCVDAYKNAVGWCNFDNIKEFDANESVYLPSGVYYAKKGGNLCCYKDGQEYDTDINVGVHPFNIQIYNNSIYVSDAGDQYYYMAKGESKGGDGAIYRIDKVGDRFIDLLIRNKGAAFNDPFTCWIDTVSGELYSCTRSQGVYKIDLSNVDWNSSELSQMNYLVSTWSQLPAYNNGISYGAITHGIQKDKDNVYWQLFDYAGNGIHRYTESLSRVGEIIGSGLKLTAFYLDEANGYLYAFSRSPYKYGLYRIAISKLDKSDNLNNWELIDNSPASPENTTTDEGVHVRQIIGDGNYIYWSYIADAENVETDNPLHKSGIKMISATGKPNVSYLVPNVEAYGFAVVKDSSDSGVESISIDETKNEIISVTEQSIIAKEELSLLVYAIGGQLILQQSLESNQQLNLENLSSGLYIIKAISVSGTSQVEKVLLR